MTYELIDKWGESTRQTVETKNGKKCDIIYIVGGDCITWYKWSELYTNVQHQAKEHLYKWASGLHGNAPSGTPWRYFEIKVNGKKVRLVDCI